MPLSLNFRFRPQEVIVVRFSSSRTSQGWGGALNIESVNVEIINCSFVNNVDPGSNANGFSTGSAIHWGGESSSQFLNIKNSIFSGNNVPSIYSSKGTMWNSIIDNPIPVGVPA